MRIIVLLVLWSVHPAIAAPLVATVTREPIESALVVRPLTAGATVLERYRAPRAPLRRGPHVAIVRLPDINSPDRVTATASTSGAMPSRRRIDISIVTRRFTGKLSANIVTTPYVEVDLGELEPGSYTLEVHELIEQFDNLTTAATTGKRGGLSAISSFEVR